MIASHLGHQKNKMRSKKQCMRIFYNLHDVSMVNTWILIKLVQNEKEHKRLSDFRASVAESFCKVQQLVPLKRGRPSDQLQIQLAKKKAWTNITYSSHSSSFRPRRSLARMERSASKVQKDLFKMWTSSLVQKSNKLFQAISWGLGI